MTAASSPCDRRVEVKAGLRAQHANEVLFICLLSLELRIKPSIKHSLLKGYQSHGRANTQTVLLCLVIKLFLLMCDLFLLLFPTLGQILCLYSKTGINFALQVLCIDS